MKTEITKEALYILKSKNYGEIHLEDINSFARFIKVYGFENSNKMTKEQISVVIKKISFLKKASQLKKSLKN